MEINAPGRVSAVKLTQAIGLVSCYELALSRGSLQFVPGDLALSNDSNRIADNLGHGGADFSSELTAIDELFDGPIEVMSRLLDGSRRGMSGRIGAGRRKRAT